MGPTRRCSSKEEDTGGISAGFGARDARWDTSELAHGLRKTHVQSMTILTITLTLISLLPLWGVRDYPTEPFKTMQLGVTEVVMEHAFHGYKCKLV